MFLELQPGVPSSSVSKALSLSEFFGCNLMANQKVEVRKHESVPEEVSFQHLNMVNVVSVIYARIYELCKSGMIRLI